MFSRIDSKYVTEPNTGCWLWVGSINQNGYAMIAACMKGKCHGGKPSSKQLRVSRVMYSRYVGVIQDGDLLRHTCDVRLCVSPYHLVPGNERDNAHDCARRGRSYKRLNDELLLEIVDAMERGLSNRKTAAKFGINSNTAWKISAGKLNAIRLAELRRPHQR